MNAHAHDAFLQCGERLPDAVRSRTVRYAVLASLRYQMLAQTTTGTSTKQHSASCQLMASMTAHAATNSRALTMNVARPCPINSCIASTSAVTRLTITPVRLRSK